MEVRTLYAEPAAPAEAIRGPALELVDVFKIYRSGPVETVALRGVDLRIESGELVAIVGPSGCGKSTLLHLAAGLDQPSAGEVRAFGRPLGRLDDNELAAYRAEVAVVFQSGNLWPALTTEENVALSLRLSRRTHDRGEVLAALERFGLASRAGSRAGVLSGGEQQRAAIAAAAARKALLVLADEPTGELDLESEQVVLDAFARLRVDGGATILVVTHSLRVAAVADRVIELRDGRVAASSS